MSKRGYLIVDARSSDPVQMAEYRRLSQLAVEAYGGRFLVRGAPYETLEGHWQPQRLVVVEFPSVAVAREFYDSPEYMAARTARAGISNFDMVLTEAY